MKKVHYMFFALYLIYLYAVHLQVIIHNINLNIRNVFQDKLVRPLFEDQIALGIHLR